MIETTCHPMKRGSPVQACLEIVPCKRTIREAQHVARKRHRYLPRNMENINYKEKDFVLVVEKQSLDTLIGELIKVNSMSLVDDQIPCESVNEIDRTNDSGASTKQDFEPQNESIADAFWYDSQLVAVPSDEKIYQDETPDEVAVNQDMPIIFWDDRIMKPFVNEKLLPTSASTTNMNVELTPPCSTDSDSVTSSDDTKDSSSVTSSDDTKDSGSVASSGDTDDWQFSTPKSWYHPKVECTWVDEEVTSQAPHKVNVPQSTCIESPKVKSNDSLIQSCLGLEVHINPIQPSLQQLQDLFERQKQSSFRENYLRPKKSLRQFVPFAISSRLNCQWKQNSRHILKLIHSKSNTSPSKIKKNRIQKNKRRVSCQAMLFKSANKDLPKLELKQKKDACKLRNMHGNALDSINRRIHKQNLFWRMLSG